MTKSDYEDTICRMVLRIIKYINGLKERERQVSQGKKSSRRVVAKKVRQVNARHPKGKDKKVRSLRRAKRNERFGQSVMSDDEWNNTEKAMRFLEPISDYLASCGLEMPSSQQYKDLRDLEVQRRQDYQKPQYKYPESTGEPLI